MRQQALPDAPHVLGRHRRQNHRAAVEAIGIIRREPYGRRDPRAGQQARLLPVLLEPFDRFFKGAPHRDDVAALGEKHRAARGHGSVAEDGYVFSHARTFYRKGGRSS